MHNIKITPFNNFGSRSLQRQIVDNTFYKKQVRINNKYISNKCLIVTPFFISNTNNIKSLEHSLWGDGCSVNLEKYYTAKLAFNNYKNTNINSAYIYGALEALQDIRPLLKEVRALLMQVDNPTLHIRVLDDADYKEESFFRQLSLDEIINILTSFGFTILNKDNNIVTATINKKSFKEWLVKNNLDIGDSKKIMLAKNCKDTDIYKNFKYLYVDSTGFNGNKDLNISSILSNKEIDYFNNNDHHHNGDALLQAVLQYIALTGIDDFELIGSDNKYLNMMRIIQAQKVGMLPGTIKTKFICEDKESALNNINKLVVDNIGAIQNIYRDKYCIENSNNVQFSSAEIEYGYKAAGIFYLNAIKTLDLIYTPQSNDVTVIVPCFNTDLEQVKDLCCSLNNQSVKPYEVIFIDDGSTLNNYYKDTQTVVTSTYSGKSRVIKQQNKGHAGARNTGLKNATTKYIITVDSDDVLNNYLVEDLLFAIGNNREYIAFTPYVSDFEDMVHNPAYFRTNAGEYHPTGSTVGTAFSPINYFGSACAIFITDELINTTNGWDETDKSMWEDWSLYVKLTGLGKKIGILPKNLYYYRIREKSEVRISSHKLGANRLIRNLSILPQFDSFLLYYQTKYIAEIQDELVRNKALIKELETIKYKYRHLILAKRKVFSIITRKKSR